MAYCFIKKCNSSYVFNILREGNCALLLHLDTARKAQGRVSYVYFWLKILQFKAANTLLLCCIPVITDIIL